MPLRPSAEGRATRRLGLVLSGGGARGLAHAGFLRALEHLGYRPGVIVGVSMGAVVGATYALNPRWYDDLIAMDTSGFPPLPDFSEPGMLHHFKNLRIAQKVISGMYFGWGIGQPAVDWGRGLLAHLTRDGRLEEGRVPVYASATDVTTGERVVIESADAGCRIHGPADEPVRFCRADVGRGRRHGRVAA